MVEGLREIYYRLLRQQQNDTFRYLYHSFAIDNRLTGLVGPRGVGKTTMLLQFIKNKIKDPGQAFYFSADHIYFNTISLYEFIRKLYEEEDIRLFFIDEIHKYHNWDQELKNIYDSFPPIKIVFSGSSSLDLQKGRFDLSRRGVLYYLTGMSFREYLNFSTGNEFDILTLEDIVHDPVAASVKISQLSRLKGYFKEYVRQGYYPFIFESGSHFDDRIEAIINKIIYEDIANYYNLKTVNLHYFKQIISFLATIPPGQISIHNLANSLGIDSKTALNYVHILSDTGLARLLNSGQRGSKLLRTPEKVFLENTTLLHALCQSLGQAIDTGTQRELFFVTSVMNSGRRVSCKKKHGDYVVDDIVFEIGGKNKSRRQIKKSIRTAFVVKDDILYGGPATIPLYLFGFLY